MSRIEPLDQVRKSHIREVLAHARGDLSLACRILDVSADDLQRLLVVHGLEPVRQAANPPATPEDE